MQIGNLISLPEKVVNKAIGVPYRRSLISKCGKDVYIGRRFRVAGGNNIEIGEGTAIGHNCTFYAEIAPLKIGRYVMISPNVTILTGEHRTDLIGEYMRKVDRTQKCEGNDKPIIIEDDVWIGAGVIIMKGARIGRGSVIHAGSVISGKVRPYTIYINDKLKVGRFTDAQIQQHEALIKEKYGISYPEYHPKSNSMFS